MTDQQHPITPSPELVEQWWTEFERADFDTDSLVFVATQAARWGADQELNECCEWVGQFNYDDYSYGERLRAARRRPKPPSKKRRGLTALEATNLKEDDPLLYQEILKAIEGLPDD